MTKLLKISLLLILVLFGIIYNSCEDEETYDMFSYKVGNEYYYKYYRKRSLPIQEITEGIEAWKVISKTSFTDSNVFTIERKLNASLYVFGDTIIVSDSIRFINVVENKEKSTFSILGFDIARYQDEPEIEIERRGEYDWKVCWRCTLRADSSLTKYSYYHPPNQVVNESLLLDSIKISR